MILGDFYMIKGHCPACNSTKYDEFNGESHCRNCNGTWSKNKKAEIRWRK